MAKNSQQHSENVRKYQAQHPARAYRSQLASRTRLFLHRYATLDELQEMIQIARQRKQYLMRQQTHHLKVGGENNAIQH